MKTLTIKNGRLISPVNGLHGDAGDIVVKDGRIAEVGSDLEAQGEVIDAKGRYVTPGFIDIHTHCYPKAFLGLSPDVLGLDRGATTIVDAGSSGSDTYDDFRSNYIDTAQTKVFTLLNISREGLIRGHELDDPAKVDVASAMACARAHADNIVGLKARASASVVGDQGLAPISVAAQTAHELKLPLMVHVGNCPPALGEVIDLLDTGDIITHAFHGKPGGILNEDGTIIAQAVRGRQRGVRFDVGHGVASFAFKTYQRAMAAGFDCDSISSDLHVQNWGGPVFGMATTLSKVMACGEPFEDAISKCTSAPARYFGLSGLGEIAPGMVADLNIVTVDEVCETVEDAMGERVVLDRRMRVHTTIYSRGDTSAVIDRA